MAPMERVQVLGFSIQEVLISAIYIYSTMQMLKGSFNKKIKKTIAFLIAIQVIVILADVVVITVDYCQYFTLKAVLHSFVYAFKLQLEFVILNQFKEVIAKGGIAPRGLEALQGDMTPPSPPAQPSPPTKAAGKRWWGSFITISPVNQDQVQGGDRSVSTRSLEGTNAAPAPAPTQMVQAGAHVKPYVAGETDIERQYLGAWDRVERPE